jgi:hypothetical protein
VVDDGILLMRMFSSREGQPINKMERRKDGDSMK